MPDVILSVGVRDTPLVIREAKRLGLRHQVQIMCEVSRGALVNSLRIRYEGKPERVANWLRDLLEEAVIIASRDEKEHPGEALSEAQITGSSAYPMLTKWHWVWICALALLGGIAVALLMEVL